MNNTPEPTLRDVMDSLHRINGRLEENGEQIRSLRDRMDRIDERLSGVDERLHRVDGRLSGVDERLDRIDEQVRKLNDRMDELEQGVANVIENGFARVEAAVRGLAETKADRSEVAALRADVDALKEAAG